MILYYYTSAKYAINDVSHNRVKLSLLDSINDPSEWVPNVTAANANMTIEEARSHIIKTLSTTFGFVSLSGSWNVGPLWGNYADKYRGVVLQFEVKDEFVSQVVYTDKRVECTTDIKKEYNAEEFDKLAGTKSTDWWHENEYRVLMTLTSDSCFVSGENYFCSIGRDMGKGFQTPFSEKVRMRLKSVICGPLMNISDIGKLEFILSERYKEEMLKLNNKRAPYQDKESLTAIPVIGTRFSSRNFGVELVGPTMLRHSPGAHDSSEKKWLGDNLIDYPIAYRDKELVQIGKEK